MYEDIFDANFGSIDDQMKHCSMEGKEILL